MGCACKVNQRIEEIQKHYGHNNKKTIKTNISNRIKIQLKKIGIFVLCIPFLPIMLIYIIWNWLSKNKPMSIEKIFKLKK